ncbi:MAG: uroporphyrinogen-III synthase [Gammaproteobacteria bacterium]|nr:uroporphyrinogen-III synthase [Gammaproteobacteria bacterium]
MSGGRVIVTRPVRDAAIWVDGLRAAGVDARPLPLIAIEALADTAAAAHLSAARDRMATYSALMFVSAAAAEFFFQDGSEIATAPHGPRFWATGPGTTAALGRAGVPAAIIDAPASDAEQFDSEALWQIVRSQVGPGSRVLIVRGGDAAGRPAGRDWLARQIVSAGGVCNAVVAYRRFAPRFGDAERRLANEAADGSGIWLFSSSEAIANLRHAVPDIDWRASRAIATHERIAQAAKAAGFGRVRESRPSLVDVLASIESFE